MGGFRRERNHLLNLVPKAFSRECKQKSFQRAIVDMMQYVVGVIKHEKEDRARIHSSKIIRVVQNTVDYHMNQQQDYQIKECLIFLLDTPEYVPSLKAVTQKSRDCNNNNNNNNSIFNSTDFTIHCQKNDIVKDNYLMINEDSIIEIDRTKAWRSIGPRLQLYRVITLAVIAMDVRPGLVLLLDDGLAINDSTYCGVRNDMINDHGFNTRSEYDKECLVASLSRHHMTERIYIYPDDKIARQPCAFIGEADIKICHYITPDVDSTIIHSQDNDSLYIALLHGKTLADPNTRRIDDRYEIVIDTQTPKDQRRGISRPYRFVDIKILYNSIMDLFEKEYPTIKNPIETIAMLAYTIKTDYTQPFHRYLGITERVVWDTFSELHSINRDTIGYIAFNDTLIDDANNVKNNDNEGDDDDSDDENADGDDNNNNDDDDDDDDEVVPTSKSASKKKVGGIIRSTTRYLPHEMKNILSDAIICCYNVENDAHDLDVNEGKWTQFYYLLCEFKVRKDLAHIGYSDYNNKLKNRYILDVDQLFLKIVELEELIDVCRKDGLDAIRKIEAEKNAAFLACLESEKKAAADLVNKALEERKRNNSMKIFPSMISKKPQQQHLSSSGGSTNRNIRNECTINITGSERKEYEKNRNHIELSNSRENLSKHEWSDMFDSADSIFMKDDQNPQPTSKLKNPSVVTKKYEQSLLPVKSRNNDNTNNTNNTDNNNNKPVEKTEEEKKKESEKRDEWLKMFESVDCPVITTKPLSSSTTSLTKSSSVPSSHGITPIIDKKIVTLCKRKNIPPRYGVPEMNRMKARIYRIRWILNYHQNGWLSTDYSMNFDATHYDNYNKSLHGWRSIEISQKPETIARGDFNNSYLTFQHIDGPPVHGIIPFRIFETFETDDIYDRDYTHYFF